MRHFLIVLCILFSLSVVEAQVPAIVDPFQQIPNKTNPTNASSTGQQFPNSTFAGNVNQLTIFQGSIKPGISIGFNYFWNNQKNYVVGFDSTIHEFGAGKGLSGIVSGVLSIRMTEKNNHHILVNIPLGDFTSDANQAIGLFNKRMAVGLGYSYAGFKNTPELSLSAIFNISPYKRIDYNLLSGIKFSEPYLTNLDPQRYGVTSEVSYSISLGIVYSFLLMP